MLALSLLWLLLGLIIGALANAAKLRPAFWHRRGWLIILAIGALAALMGGWLGVLFVSKYFATGCAIWVAVLGAVVPKLISLLISARVQQADTSA